MLTELIVEDLGVIDRAEVVFEDGCIALTGETGAGKTLLVAALELLLGARSDRDMVRTGARAARVEGRFVVPATHPVTALLVDEGVLDPPDGAEAEVVIARSVPSSGGGAAKARVNGRLVTASLLARAGGLLVEVAGQHAHQDLGSANRQRAHLDAWGGPDAVALAAEVRDAVRDAAEWAARVDELRGSARERSRRLDLLRYEVSEIEAAAPEPGESDRLAAEARRLAHAEELAAGLDRAAEALSGDGGAQDLAAAAAASLRALVDADPSLGDLADRLESAAYEIADVAGEIARRSASSTPDPDALEAANQRISVLARLRRKYGADEEEVAAYLDRARSAAAELEGLEEGVGEAESRAADARARAESLAARLSDLRRAAAATLGPEIERRLATLALDGARFVVALAPTDLFEGGFENVEYLVTFNRGEDPRPIRKVASGGELSRLGLALALAVSSADASTMVFDEVDAGVGGEVARSVGAALAELAAATGVQVMVVTHLPQVAAFASAQYRVGKSLVGGRSSATVERVTGAARTEELSRMLAGMPDSERARGHAEELLEDAARARASVGEPAGRA